MNALTNDRHERVLTELDQQRVARWIRHTEPDSAPFGSLDDLLAEATVVPSRDVPPDVVTMNSQVLLREVADGKLHTFTVCYPADAKPAAGAVSVLSPVGSALLGTTAGSLAEWTLPGGRSVRAQVIAVLYQPEASGDFTR